MHIIQALKMACKSLWSNKLRSFLTMLGIIIGVVTVALLTSVASGVSGAVVSSIRQQSTMGVLMNMSNKLTFSKANTIISGVQSEIDEESDEYFEYALTLSASSVVANGNIEGEASETIDESNFFFDQAYEKPENYNDLPDDQKTVADQLAVMKARSKTLSTQISAVTANYAEVYNLKIKGEFPSKTNEILVDEAFVKTYLNDFSLEDAIGQEVTLGASVKTDVKITFSEAQQPEMATMIVAILGEMTLENAQVLSILADQKTIVVRADYFRIFTNETMKTALQKALTTAGSTEVVSSVALEDFYDMTNAKAFKIVGTISSEDNSSMFSSSMTSDSAAGQQDLNAMTLLTASMSSSKGSIYMLADNQTKGVLGLAADETIEGQALSSAYFRFKTEDVMDSVINKISMGFLNSQLMIMQDFMLVSLSSVANIISNIMGIMTTMLTVISVISLIVGGIGIMNIMLVAVTERTREIGIRKAIGAKRSAILVQFLVEALMLSLIGGLIGLGLSALGCLAIGNAMGIAISMPLWVVGMSLGFCTAIGLIFGMFPAIKASKMQPIDALRRD